MQASLFPPARRRFLRRAAQAGAAAGLGLWRVAGAQSQPIRVGVVADLSGALASSGISIRNTVHLGVEAINRQGGLLGRPVEVLVEDSATNEATGVVVARRLVQRDKVDVVIGGGSSAMRNAVKDVIAGRGRTLYLYTTVYEGGECTPGVFCTGATPTQLCRQLVPWLMRSGARRFALPGSHYVFPQTVFAYAAPLIERLGGQVVYQDHFALDQVDFSAPVARMVASRPDFVLTLVIPPGAAPFVKQLHEAGFQQGGGRLASLFYEDRILAMHPPTEVEGLVSCYDYFRAAAGVDAGSARLQAAYDARYGDAGVRTSGALHSGSYRALALWAAAVRQAGSVQRGAVEAALDGARAEETPGGPAAMVPGSRHCALNTYVAVAQAGRLQLRDRSAQLQPPRQCGT